MSRNFLCGDPHGDEDRKKLRTLRESGNTVDKNDNLIILGDAGILFEQTDKALRRQKMLIDFYDHMPCNVFFIDGNHDNHTLLHDLPKEGFGGGVVGRVSDNIRHLKRGYVYEIGYQKFFAFGGARSIDQNQRTIGIDWWPEEVPNRKQTERGFDNLLAHNWDIDYVITHTGPRSILNYFGKTDDRDNLKDPTATYLETIMEKITYKHWYFGHIHMDATQAESRITCLFNRVKEI